MDYIVCITLTGSLVKIIVGDSIIMSIQVKLKDIIEEMELQFDESRTFLNIKTGEIISVTTDDLRAAEDEEPYDHLPD
jgi:hypothetical protein